MNDQDPFATTPPLPPAGQPVLLRVADKTQVRALLRRMLASWSALPPEELPLHETGRGPRWIGLLENRSLDISLSYCGQEGWIGLLRGGRIGIDAMRVEPFAEAPDVAQHYLGPKARAAIEASADPARAFALAWTELETRLKCLRRDLSEWSAGSGEAAAGCVTKSFMLSVPMVVTMAVA